MLIMIMRHGEAAMHAPSDAERSLTEHGRQHCIQTANWLKTQVPSLAKSGLDKALVSPYLRAQQTMDAVSSVLDAESIETLPELTPSGNEERVADYLLALAEQGVSSVLVVSHLPLVGYLVSELCPDVYPPMFATSAVVGITLDPENDEAEVDWHFHG